ncbi:hypothetical protein SAPIO_CDS0788 [Scedosporium apiospermum]|uniref:Complex 1 LYR protein domain-containing protein n=1 Tax=Pseudallescheria apiosperma TaxID=563466 RepID=A0A084GGJ8_PSEDA|nr:uncharacterized protein SAPIO_CDS0788 [Scedosporium apiospermum]KEZ46460.1 hypothetical protein SAPIO_CDS0788 [Scedosporium apiospermum]
MGYSGLQREVLSLYRQCLRACRAKPADARPGFKAFARESFEKNLGMSKRDFGLIEYQLRKGKRQLELYSRPEIRKIGVQ